MKIHIRSIFLILLLSLGGCFGGGASSEKKENSKQNGSGEGPNRQNAPQNNPSSDDPSKGEAEDSSSDNEPVGDDPEIMTSDTSPSVEKEGKPQELLFTDGDMKGSSIIFPGNTFPKGVQLRLKKGQQFNAQKTQTDLGLSAQLTMHHFPLYFTSSEYLQPASELIVTIAQISAPELPENSRMIIVYKIETAEGQKIGVIESTKLTRIENKVTFSFTLPFQYKSGAFQKVEIPANAEEIAEGQADASEEITDISKPAIPVFSPLPGSYTTDQIVTISNVDQEAGILYSVDGSFPSISYTGPVTLTSGSSTTLKAIASKDGQVSELSEGVYQISSPPSPAVLEFSGLTDFGFVYHHQSPKTTLTLTNNGFATATDIELQALSSAYYTYHSESTCDFDSSFSLIPEESCSLVLEFSPKQIGVQVETVTLNYNDSTSATSESVNLTAEVKVIVEPVYPSNGANWTNWIERSNTGKDIFEQADLPCNGLAENRENACIHGGDKLKIVLPGKTSCVNLTIVTSISKLNWTCIVRNSTAIFYSSLATDIKMSEFVDWTQSPPEFFEVSATISESATPIAVSDAATWWNSANHEFVELPSNPTTSDAPATLTEGADGVTRIYYITSNRNSSGYRITTGHENIAIITANSSWLYHNGYSTTDDCKIASGSVDTCLLYQENSSYIWYEVNTVGDNAAKGLVMYASGSGNGNSFNMVRGSYFYNTSGHIWINDDGFADGAELNFFHGIYTQSSASVSLYFSGGRYNQFLGLRTHVAGSYGLYIIDALDNVFQDIIVSNTVYPGSGGLSGVGIQVTGTSERNRFVNVLSGANDYADLIISEDASENIFLNFTGAFSNGISNTGFGGGIEIYGDSNHLVNTMVYGNGNSSSYYSRGLFLYGGTDCDAGNSASANQNKIHNFASFYNLIGIWDCMSSDGAASTHNVFSGGLVLGGNSIDCGQGPSNYTSPGDNANCASDAPFNGGNVHSSTVSIVGPVGDGFHTSPTTAGGYISSYSSITNWHSFQSSTRFWGVAATNPWDVANRGTCYGHDCQIYDLALSNSDTSVRNMTNAYPGFTGNETLTPNANCPAAVNGNNFGRSLVMSGGSQGLSSFLYNAVEEIGDGIGNEDGLCNTGETCVYSPNYGYYQGHGSLVRCNFVNGTDSNSISNVNMSGSGTNGY